MLGALKEGQINAGPKLSPQFVYESYIASFIPGAPPANDVFLENYNLVIAGASSILKQDVMPRVLGVGGKVFVLDCGRNFKYFCETLGGRYIEFNPSRPISINPFAILPTGDDRFSSEARYYFHYTMLIMLATMVEPKLGASDSQKIILSRALSECLKQKGKNTEIDDIAHWLLSQKGGRGFDREANNLGRMLYNYTTEGAYGGFFNGPPQANLDAEIVVIETDHLQKFPDLMAVVIQIMITYINDSMEKKSATKPSLLVFNEMVKTLEHPLTLACALKISRIIRRYRASMVVAPQSMADFDNLGPDAASLFDACTYKLFNEESEKC